MKRHPLLCSLFLSASLLSAASAQAADAPAAATTACIQLGSDQQMVRAGVTRDVLLRNGQDHYVVHFQRDCTAAARSRTLSFATEGQQNLLCSDGRSTLRTDTERCAVARVEHIDPASFARKARQRRR
ncbi:MULTISPECIES: hypothetical protein [Stenotrophomonas]|jgi:hypothetical protein|uniref:hypothetical protein n=1 Tax=Stenotrophomonas TaxID=40323 RepID=UPI00201CF409|nr:MULTISPECIES: hypothetical protein [Stenotrophomonas]MBN5023882.1 hypothetical protein [Stenotrophomonas maltophilia]MDH1273556.1 hypothetical protein [Stenotrophomonas sp. GD03937]MDH1483158.1 hypothetical protein [Stenotrophomonas sp. GD03712]UQY96833.1 hypothetical protein LZ605_05580 [Stenotrophomonas maltophilia]WON70622.1 hypothetical protein RWT08_09940 [Stenotrophomonas maltophilia]